MTSIDVALPSTLLRLSEAVYRRTFITLVAPPPNPTQPAKSDSGQTIKPSPVPQSSSAPQPSQSPTEQPKPAPAPPPQSSPPPQSPANSQSNEPSSQTSTQPSTTRTRETTSTTTAPLSVQPTDTTIPPFTGPKQAADEPLDSARLSPPHSKGLSRGAEVGVVIGSIGKLKKLKKKRGKIKNAKD